MLIDGMNNGRKLMREAGASKTYAFGPVKESGWHPLGTCRMGDDSQTSVVNKDKCHDTENLYIVDGSIFPSAGGEPCNTIQSVALYVA